jgi:hypothetical protein
LDVEIIPIKESLCVELDFEVFEAHKEYFGSLLYNSIVINSIEQLYTPFETLELEVPNALKQVDFEKYTFLLSFYLSGGRSLKDVKHRLTRNFKTGQYTYSVTFFYNLNEELESEVYVFYTGILVEKLPDNSDIKVVMAASTSTK